MKKIAANYFKLNISKGKVLVPYFPFSTKEELYKIKANNLETYFMHSNEEVYHWNGNLSYLAKKEIRTDRLILKLIESSITKSFKENISFECRKKMHTYKVTLIDDDLSKGQFKGLELYKTFHIHFTKLYMEKNVCLGFTISTSITEKSNWIKKDFYRNNIKCDDLKFDEKTELLVINSKARNRLANHFKYASNLKIALDNLNAIQNEYHDINNFLKTYLFSKLDYFILPDDLKILSIEETSFFLKNEEGEFKNKILDTPQCYFYKGRFPNFENTYNLRYKIGYNKPFSYDEFESRKINISLIYPKSEYLNVANFFKSVQDELIKTFKIKKENFQYTKYEMEDIELKSYQDKLRIINSTDLVIVVVDESHELLSPNKSPYFFCKTKFIEKNLNTQEVQIQQIYKFLSDKKERKSYNYTDHNIALNIYAKLGGMAWTIKPKEEKNELVIGIGATTDKKGQPILGLASVFRGDGKYLFGEVSSTNMDNYSMSLENIITKSIQTAIDDEILDVEKPFHLMFHIYKPVGKDNEIKALERVIEKFIQYQFKYTFVHLGGGHNYRFFTFDEHQGQITFDLKRGLAQNKRGTFIKLNNTTAFLGLQELNSRFYKIRIDDRSSFSNLEYVVKQIYQFAEMSHTSYNKQGKPVTIKYPSLMAKFAEKFNEVNGFYLTEISMPNNSLWFI